MFLIILAVLVAAGFLAVGASRLRLIPLVIESTRRLGFNREQLRLVGLLEIVFAVLVVLGIWVGWLGTFGSLMLTVIAAGMILAHARVADPPKEIIPPAALGILAFILFLGHIYT